MKLYIFTEEELRERDEAQRELCRETWKEGGWTSEDIENAPSPPPPAPIRIPPEQEIMKVGDSLGNSIDYHWWRQGVSYILSLLKKEGADFNEALTIMTKGK